MTYQFVRSAHGLALIITSLLMPLVYVVVWLTLTGPFPPEVKSLVVGSVVTGVLSSITGFWLGASVGHNRDQQLTQ